jgi:hypothetical protein
MSRGISLIQHDNRLVELREQAYDSETLLQELLARHPSLLSGDQIDPDSPRRWLLVRREAPVPGEQGGGGRWSVDHLFLDQDAIPTLVEVKRSSDTRIRREERAYRLVRARVGLLEADRALAPDIEAVAALVREGTLAEVWRG